jgi:hypothetical protein
LLYRGTAGTTTPLFVGLGGRTAALTAKNVKVWDLAGFSDYGWCLSRVAVPAAITPTLSGIELVTNGTMEAGDPPTGWSQSGAALDGVADEHTGGLGAQSLSVLNSGAASGYSFRNVTLAVGSWYMFSVWCKMTNGTFTLQSYLQDQTTFADMSKKLNTSFPTWIYLFSCGRAINATNRVILQNNSTTSGDGGRFDDVSTQAITLPSTLGTPQTIGAPDFWGEITVTLTAGTQAGVMLCINDPANPTSFVLAYHDGTNFHAVKCVNGTYAAESINVAATYSAAKRICYAKEGSSWWFWYNEVLMTGSPVTISDAEIVSNKTHTWFSTYAGNTFAELGIYPRQPQIGGV